MTEIARVSAENEALEAQHEALIADIEKLKSNEKKE